MIYKFINLKYKPYQYYRRWYSWSRRLAVPHDVVFFNIMDDGKIFERVLNISYILCKKTMLLS